jgi:hypothetical protein
MDNTQEKPPWYSRHGGTILTSHFLTNGPFSFRHFAGEYHISSLVGKGRAACFKKFSILICELKNDNLIKA